MKRIVAVCMIGMWVIGCGGGGGGGGDSSNGIPPEQERAQAFSDEAIRVANQNAMVECDQIVCSITDNETETVRPTDGVVTHACQWDCLESQIDDSGETRNYLIYLVWQRFPDGCFEPSEFFLQQEILGLCVPNQERF